MSDLHKLIFGGHLSDRSWKLLLNVHKYAWILFVVLLVMLIYRYFKPCKKTDDSGSSPKMACIFWKGYGKPVTIIAIVVLLSAMILMAGIGAERWN